MVKGVLVRCQVSDLFYTLTPDRVLDAVEQGGLHPSGYCRALNSLENRVFEIGLDDGTHVVAKFYRPGRWSFDQITEEHRFLLELARNEIPVIAPLPVTGVSETPSVSEYQAGEDTIASVSFPDDPEHSETERGVAGAEPAIWYSLWPLAGGREPSEFSEEELGITGRLLARIHNAGSSLSFQHRPLFTPGGLGTDSLNYLIKNGFIPEHLRERYKVVVDQTVRAAETLLEGVPFHPVHGDCHIGNLLFGRDGWYFLDFDDCMTGPAVQDIWMISSGRGPEEKEKLAVFLDAYSVFRDFDYRWLKLVEPLRSLRYIHYSAWVARRQDDPAFGPAFPHFGTEQYWVSELNDLEEQYNNHILPLSGGVNMGVGFDFSEGDAVSAAGDQPDQGGDKELTNKDFFWDMDE